MGRGTNQLSELWNEGYVPGHDLIVERSKKEGAGDEYNEVHAKCKICWYVQDKGRRCQNPSGESKEINHLQCPKISGSLELNLVIDRSFFSLAPEKTSYAVSPSPL